ncbi:MAG: hypothetical protein P0Y66_12040 [Candidatus Kaistia colombiensis]|nr:MAG: hypothetical protein P0Y66_12040 [Kaistia sp.]
MSLSKSALGLAALAFVAGSAALSASSPALAGSNTNHGPTSILDPNTGPLADWEVFGFDLSSVPDDPASLAAFRTSLDPWTQQGIANRCRYDITLQPFRYSPKVRDFCWSR